MKENKKWFHLKHIAYIIKDISIWNLSGVGLQTQFAQKPKASGPDDNFIRKKCIKEMYGFAWSPVLTLWALGCFSG